MALIRHHLIFNNGLPKATLKHRDRDFSPSVAKVLPYFCWFCKQITKRGFSVFDEFPFPQLQAPFPWCPQSKAKGRSAGSVLLSSWSWITNLKSPSVHTGHGLRLIPAPREMSSSLIPWVLSQQRVGFGHPAPRILPCKARLWLFDCSYFHLSNVKEHQPCFGPLCISYKHSYRHSHDPREFAVHKTEREKRFNNLHQFKFIQKAQTL